MSEFRQALAAATGVAARAPSSHNSQPWGLARASSPGARRWVELSLPRLEGADEALVLAVDRDREIHALPSLRLEVEISCAMYLEEALRELAARGFGAGEVVPLDGRAAPDLAGWPPSWAPLAAVRLSRLPEPAPVREAALPVRVTNRAPYRPEPVEPEVLDRLARLSTLLAPAGALDLRLRVDLIAGGDRIRSAGDYVGRHAGVDFAHREAWRETYRYFRFGRRECERAEDGFPVTQIFGPLSGARRALYRLILWPPAMSLLARFGFDRRLARGLGELVSGSPLLAVFAFAEERPGLGTRLAAGGAVMDFWRRATAEGLALHPVSVVLQHEALRSRLQAELGIAGRAFFFCRMGHPTLAFPPAPRRSPDRALREV